MNTSIENTEALFDYLVVVNPDVLVSKDIVRIRQFIGREIGDEGVVNSSVQIPLFRSVFPERFQEMFMETLEGIAKEQAGFAVYTSRIDSHQHEDGRCSIFVNVANVKPLVSLQRALLQCFDLPQQDYRPHIMVAGRIQHPGLSRSLPQLSQQMFVRSFNCHCFSLLRRPSTGGKYERVRDFVFGDIEHMVGSLFNYAA
ncbi:2'-5' RNA ligase superfamily protein [Chitinophaga jiangningensis]|uniref:2'-5' RNA ligase superfamily protein n=1 Tax=Chitinophaga jiangningensis TaxID=1419482 RepID=A0A1M6YJY0_9BACT|nr:2'-5' RNA ligase family protein [Chitinophaga jiangningensis]SHL18566.1 2'-5' RNA ligase superfamily protein [Chitinophaga jiangningensis]